MSKQQKIIHLTIGYIIYAIGIYLVIVDTSWKVGVGVMILIIGYAFMSTLAEKTKG